MPREKKKIGWDYGLVVIVLILAVIGLLILYSTSTYNGQVKFQDPYYYLKKQAFATVLGLAAMFFAAKIDYHVWKPFAPAAYLIAIGLSTAVLFIGE